MSIDFDPRARAIGTTTAAADTPTAASETVDTPIDAQGAVTEMDLLFSGQRGAQAFRAQHPLQPINVPGFEGDILGSLPVLGHSSTDVGAIVRQYTILKNNLVDRRNNFAHALEGYLQPDETLDLYARLDQLDRAIVKVEQELDKAQSRKRDLQAREREQRREALEEADRDAAAAERARRNGV